MSGSAPRSASITLDSVGDIAADCRRCVFWELDPAAWDRGLDDVDGALAKEAWISDTLLEWGSCGRIAYVGGRPAGHVLFAPPAYVPRGGAFPTAPASSDAVLLMTARVRPEYLGTGVGRLLVQAVAADVVRRGIRAVEAFGRGGAAGVPGRQDGTGCLVPADFLRAVGFRTVRPHPVTPRLRLDIRSTATWREDVEAALERLIGTVKSPAAAR
ncbi:Acetyltransferase (GNAT) family protein [Jatrophihabitans endophyticus]|uniref:Acetyltransferase (GNAT) family protein n=1 Tax=Jatrophihabitans endophyticus TaxID=1206085 RepID=A0A1M5HV11_9ACTN|nr:GNAT family N-acetyltransferase [Jatrophihabitans endophyticus]SHG19789.1 Acetyltransferase (GNAT) family protein [Jatrophihabitans endophyticus]